MRCFSMFSGIGGFDLALQNLGHEIVGACEIDPYARTIYERQFPGVQIHHDATTLLPESLPHFDLLCGGFPCQAFSVAGKRRGFDDTRGTLFFEIARIAKEKRPSILLLENVKGLLSHDQGKTFRTIIETLDEVGYDAEWQVINGKYFLPQNRERIFIVGHLRGSSTRQIFPLGEIYQRDSNTQREALKEGKRIQNQISGAIDANYHKGYGSRTMILAAIIEGQENSQTGRIYSSEGKARTMCAGNGGMGKNTGLYQIEKKIRRLTPLECERLQGFPEGWTEGISDTQRYKCLGNAVMVPCVQHIASKLTLSRKGNHD